jgi:hypothetical protein
MASRDRETLIATPYIFGFMHQQIPPFNLRKKSLHVTCGFVCMVIYNAMQAIYSRFKLNKIVMSIIPQFKIYNIQKRF